jgi:hypothetical protein
MPLFKRTSRSYYAILAGTLSVTIMQTSILMAASAELDGFEAGIAAFNRGDFPVARTIIADYTDHHEKQLPAKAYIFAMQDRKNPAIAPSDKLKAFIVGQVAADPLYKALSAKLHLMGYHPDSNTETGLMDLGGLGELEGNTRAYALYTLGLYREGLFTFPPSPANLIEARLKYEGAGTLGHKASLERSCAVEELLERFTYEDNGVSRGVLATKGSTSAGKIIQLKGPLSEAPTQSRMATPSMLSYQTGARFYIGASAISTISAGSEITQGSPTAPSRPSPPKARIIPALVFSALSRVSDSACSAKTADEAPSVSKGSKVSRLEDVLVTEVHSRVPATVVPAMAVGYEALYKRFLEGRIEYRPTPGSNVGMITLLFRDLLVPLSETATPLSATFDLSRCGDAGNHLSINIGYKKTQIPANKDKTELWICPKFLAERESPSSLAPIMSQWESPVGYFWTWGSYAVCHDNYDYLLNSITMDNDKNSHVIQISPRTTHAPFIEIFL